MIRPLLLSAMLALHAHAAGAPWVSSWGAAPDSAGPAMRAQTIRQLVHLSAGGSAVRLRLSNAFGTQPLTLGPVGIGKGATVLFDGQPTVRVAPGESVLSDAAALTVRARQDLVVSLHVAGGTTPTIHSDARQTAWLGEGGKVKADHRYFLSEVQVQGAAGAIVVIGDSISDGDRSTSNRNARWPDALTRRMPAVGVVNSGISGNRLLNDGPVGESMLHRFERDALDKEGVRWIVLEAGLNDIGLSGEADLPGGEVSAEQVIAGLQQLAERAHARGIKVWGATLTPYGGAVDPLRHNPTAEAKRPKVNAWIRSAAVYDHVLDFEAAVRDPRHPDRLAPRFDSGDHVHPNDAGYRALAALVQPSFLGR